MGFADFADDADLDLFGLGILQISGDFADDLQNSLLYSWWFRRKSVFLRQKC